MYSESLKRNIHVAIEYTNRADVAELHAALAALPGYPDLKPEDICRLAEAGNINARHVISTASGSGEAAMMAKEWV